MQCAATSIKLACRASFGFNASCSMLRGEPCIQSDHRAGVAVLVALHEAPNGTRRDRYNELSRDLLGAISQPANFLP